MRFAVALIIFALLSTIKAPESRAEAISPTEFRMLVNLLDRHEGESNSEALLIPRLSLFPEACAAEASSSCVIAGYIGEFRAGSCKFDKKRVLENERINCNPEIFGDISIPKPSDSRWTFACANAFVKEAGINRSTDEKMTAPEEIKLAEHLKNKNISRAKMTGLVQKLCSAAEISKNNSDIRDCHDLQKSLYPSKNEDCAKGSLTPSVLVQANDAINANLFRFDSTKHKSCISDAKDKSVYGSSHEFNTKKYKAFISQNSNSKPCFEQFFKDNAVKQFSGAYAEMLQENGSSKTIHMGTCDIDITYEGFTEKTRRKDGSGYVPVSALFKSEIRHGADFNYTNTSDLFVPVVEAKKLKQTGDVNSKLFKKIFSASSDSFITSLEARDRAPMGDELGQNYLLSLADSAYTYCSKNKDVR